MRGGLLVRMALVIGILLAPTLGQRIYADDAQGKSNAPKEDRVDGTIQMTDKTAHTVTVRVRGGNAWREVVYNDTTKVTLRNKPGTVDDLKDGRRVIVLGKVNDKKQIVASRIDVRDAK